MSKFAAAVAAVRGWLGLAAGPGRTFSTGGPINALIYGAFGQAWINGGPVSRDDALSIAAVERGRDELCSIASLPLVNYRGAEVVPNSFLDQPDPDVARVVMFAQTIEDLLCDGISWWLKTTYDYRGFPLTARRVVNVTLQPPNGARESPAPLPSGEDPRGASVWVDGVEVPTWAVIRFDSPGRPLLDAGRRTIRRALLLDALAAMYADNPRPQESFTDTDDQTVTPFTDPEVEAFLATYRQSRKRGRPAYIPRAITRMDNSSPTPAELQLVELQRQVSLELALHMGLDPEDVGVNTTSRTYFNATDRRTDKINRTLAGMMSAITDRLSMSDVTPRGQAVRWDVSGWLRPDPASAATYWQALKGMGVVDNLWIAEQAGIPADVTRRVLAAPAPAPAAPPALPAGAGGQNVRYLPAQLGPALTAARMGATFSVGDPTSAMQFSMIDFATAAPPAKADMERRTITGLALPYGAVARKYGVGFRFRPGSLEFDAANLNRLRVKDGHLGYVGVHQKVEDTKAGPVVTLKILDGPEGSPTKMQRDQLLMDAVGGLQDGLSVGVDFSLDPTDGDVVWSDAEQLFDVVRATWNETSVTPDPAFTGARVTRVAASRGGLMQCQHCGHPHPPGMACATAAQLYPAAAAPAAQPTAYAVAAAPAQQFAAPPAQPAPAGPGQPAYSFVPGYGMQPIPAAAVTPAGWPPAAAPQIQQGQFAAQLAPGAVNADELSAALASMVSGLVAEGKVASAPPVQTFAAPVNPGAMPLPGNAGPGQWTGARVVEPDPYRLGFDRKGFGIMGRGSHDFSSDMLAALRDGDIAAHQRALGFVQKHMTAMFNVATTDVDETNPTRQRPDMWVDQREYRYPMWSAVNKGALTDITPFTFPKFNSSSGLVGAHTQGTEPTGGAYTTTGQTVTPTAYSGLATINREVWDQGGNPQTSTLIWNQMVRGVNEALEALVVTTLNAGSFTALATFTAGNADRQIAGNTLGNEMEAAVALLQFVRGGYRFTDGFSAADSYTVLAGARATDGRPRYPMLGPANSNGTSETRFGAIDVAGQTWYPSWALPAAGQTAATKLGYLLDRTAVSGWASAPQRLVMDQTAVATIGLGVWGYQACAVSDTAGVRTLTWDPVA